MEVEVENAGDLYDEEVMQRYSSNINTTNCKPTTFEVSAISQTDSTNNLSGEQLSTMPWSLVKWKLFPKSENIQHQSDPHKFENEIFAKLPTILLKSCKFPNLKNFEKFVSQNWFIYAESGRIGCQPKVLCADNQEGTEPPFCGSNQWRQDEIIETS